MSAKARLHVKREKLIRSRFYRNVPNGILFRKISPGHTLLEGGDYSTLDGRLRGKRWMVWVGVQTTDTNTISIGSNVFVVM